MRLTDPLPRESATPPQYAEILKAGKRCALIRARDVAATPPDTLIWQKSCLDIQGVIWVKVYHPSLPIVKEAEEYPVVDGKLNLSVGSQPTFPIVWKDGLGEIVDAP